MDPNQLTLDTLDRLDRLQLNDGWIDQDLVGDSISIDLPAVRCFPCGKVNYNYNKRFRERLAQLIDEELIKTGQVLEGDRKALLKARYAIDQQTYTRLAEQVFQELGLRRYCCRMNFIQQPKLSTGPYFFEEEFTLGPNVIVGSQGRIFQRPRETTNQSLLTSGQSFSQSATVLKRKGTGHLSTRTEMTNESNIIKRGPELGMPTIVTQSSQPTTSWQERRSRFIDTD